MNFDIIKHDFGENKIDTVSARDLHKKLQVKSRFNDWINNRIKKFGFVENEDFFCITKNLVTQRKDGQKGTSEYKEYFVIIDMAKELAMVENSEIGRKVRRYFIELEKKFFQLIQKENQPVQTSHDFDIKSYTQQNRDLIELIKLINSENAITLHYLDKLTLKLNLKSPLDFLEIDLNSYYFIPTELGKFLNKSAVEVNKILEKKGFQEKIDGVWILTEQGEKFAIKLGNNFQTIKWKLESLI